jgi:hypothetical protein
MGMPQGSPVSPILSIIYASPLLHLVKRWTDMVNMMYINNGNIFVQAPTYKALECTLRMYYTACHTWCLKARLMIEPEKTELIFFSCPRPNPALHGQRPTTIFLSNWECCMYYTVQATDHIHYLGLYFDHKLSWDKHVSIITT